MTEKTYDVVDKITGEILNGCDLLTRNEALLYAASWADKNGYDSIQVIDRPKKGVKPYVQVACKEYARILK